MCFNARLYACLQKYDDFKTDKPNLSMDTLLVNVRIGRGGAKARLHQFEIVTSQQRNHEFRVGHACGHL